MRLASKLERPEHLGHALVLLFTIGGVPSIYAGDELGYRGIKEDRAGGDDAVRPEFTTPPTEVGGDAGDLLNLHRYLIGLRRRHPWLHEARTSALRLENRCYVYETRHGDEALIVALNLDDNRFVVDVTNMHPMPTRSMGYALCIRCDIRFRRNHPKVGLAKLSNHLLHQGVERRVRLFCFNPWAIDLANGIPVCPDLAGIPVARLYTGPNRFKGPDALCLC
jgi:hypothetical protein